MISDPDTPPKHRATVSKLIAWVFWTGFLLISVGLFAFARAVRNDVYFARYYRLHSMSGLTVAMSSYPVWIALLPLLWLPWVIGYQRQTSPKAIFLLRFIGTMCLAVLGIAVLILCSGPPVQM